MLALEGSLIGRRQRIFDCLQERSKGLWAHQFLENPQPAPTLAP